MSNPKATVKSRPLSVYKAAACVTDLKAQIAAGKSCPAVQSSPLAKKALDAQQASVAILSAMLTTKANCIKALAAATKAITTQFPKVVGRTRLYESAVDDIAHGDAAIITAAGVLSRDESTPAAALGIVTDVTSKPGKAAKETVVTWPKVPGATSYAMQANLDAAAPTGPYTALPSGSSRRRVILAPARGAQILVQIAAVASDGTQSAWCAPVLATAK